MRTPVAIGRATLLSSLLLFACTGSEPVGPPKPVEPRPPASVVIAFAADSLPVGDTVAISATVRDDRGTLLRDATVQWTSHAPAVATVAGGLLRAAALGEAVLIATAGTASDTLALRVVPRPLGRVTITPRLGPAGLALQGDTLTVVALATDDRGAPAPRGMLAIGVTGGAVLTADITDSGTVARLVTDTLATALRVRVNFLAGSVARTDSVTLPVHERVRHFRVYPTALEARPGATHPLRVDVFGRSLTTPLSRSVSYLVEDPTIASVAITGAVTMLVPGATTLSVSVDGMRQAIPLAVRAAGSTPFPIDIRIIGPQPDAATMTQLDAGVRQIWQAVLSAPAAPQQVTMGAEACGRGSPALNEVTTGVIMLVRIDSIDGPGKVAGSAGPCAYRAIGFTAVVGTITFDSADVRTMVTSGVFKDVAGHEAGHVLGIGTLWRVWRYIDGRSQLVRALSPAAGSEDPRYEGAEGNAAALALGWVAGGDPRIPIENAGGPGTRDAHWRESVFTRELMTGWASLNSPLSAFTARSLRDLGYTVDPAGADPWLPTWSGPLAASASGARGALMAAPDGFPIHRAEHLTGPRFRLDASGRPIPVPDHDAP